ncbi:hypothetical protein MMC30_005113 [Trapelia coarctata]|nr:hypothetical protein [Trapelia coarctata]
MDTAEVPAQMTRSTRVRKVIIFNASTMKLTTAAEISLVGFKVIHKQSVPKFTSRVPIYISKKDSEIPAYFTIVFLNKLGLWDNIARCFGRREYLYVVQPLDEGTTPSR